MTIVLILHHVVHRQKRIRLEMIHLQYRITNPNLCLILVVVTIENHRNDLDVIVVMNAVIDIIMNDQAIPRKILVNLIPIRNNLSINERISSFVYFFDFYTRVKR